MVDFSLAASALSKLPPSLSLSLLSYSSPKPLPNVPSLADLRKHAEAISNSVPSTDKMPSLPALPTYTAAGADNQQKEEVNASPLGVSAKSRLDGVPIPTPIPISKYKNQSKNNGASWSWSWSSYLPNTNSASSSDNAAHAENATRYDSPPSAPRYIPRSNQLQQDKDKDNRKPLALGGGGGGVRVPEHTYDSPDHRRLHSSLRKMDGSRVYAESVHSLQQPRIGDMGHHDPHYQVQHQHQHQPQNSAGGFGGKNEIVGWVDWASRPLGESVTGKGRNGVIWADP
ncbi:hypothetical protein IAT40_003160 [Kwoniella sp. CBS 6097]